MEGSTWMVAKRILVGELMVNYGTMGVELSRLIHSKDLFIGVLKDTLRESGRAIEDDGKTIRDMALHDLWRRILRR